MERRKYIRIALSPDDEVAFRQAKKETEAVTGISMSDSMYALSVIRQWTATRSALSRFISGEQT